MNRNERILLFLLACINFTHILDFMVMMPLGNYLMPKFNINAQKFSNIVAAYNYAAFVTGIVAAFVVDRYDRKKVLVVGYVGFLLGTLLCAFAPNYILLLGARIIAGLFGGLIGAQVLSIVADAFGYERRGMAMGVLMTAFSMASVLGVPISLYMANHISWHAPFFLIVGVGIFILPAVMRYVPSMKGHLQNIPTKKIAIWQTFKNIFSVRTQRAGLLLNAGLMLGHFCIIPFINPYMEFNVGISKDHAALIYMVGGALTLISAMVWGRLADKFGKLNIFILCAVLSLIPIWFITNMPPTPLGLVLTTTGIWFVMANGRTICAQAMVSNVVSAEHRGSFMSFNSSIQQLFTGIASNLAGFIIVSKTDHQLLHYDIVGYISIGVIAACVFLAGRLGVK
jgi:MFS transporter, DHA1 family, inner membrane transport protein